MKKKGILGLSTGELISLLLAVSIVLVTIYMLSQYSTLFFASAKTEGSVNNFDTLSNRITALTRHTQPIAVDDNFPYYISDDFILVAFSKKGAALPMASTCTTFTCFDTSNEQILRPPQCGDNACLCLWRDSLCEDFADDGDGGFDNIHKCTIIPDVDFIFTYASDDYIKVLPDDQTELQDFTTIKENIVHNLAGAPFPSSNKVSYYDKWSGKYAPLLIYGECQAHWSDSLSTPQRMYIETFRNDEKDETSIFMTVRSPHTTERKLSLEALHNTRTPESYWTDIKVAKAKDDDNLLFSTYEAYRSIYPNQVILDSETNKILYDFFTHLSKSDVDTTIFDNLKVAAHFLRTQKELSSASKNLTKKERMLARWYLSLYTDDPKEEETLLLQILSQVSVEKDNEGRNLNFSARERLALLYDTELPDTKKARDAYLDLYTVFPDDIHSIDLFRLAELERELIQLNQGSEEKAQEYFRAVIEKFPYGSEAEYAREELK